MKRILILIILTTCSFGCVSSNIGTSDKRKPPRQPLTTIIFKPQVNHVDLMISFLVVITVIVFGTKHVNQ